MKTIKVLRVLDEKVILLIISRCINNLFEHLTNSDPVKLASLRILNVFLLNKNQMNISVYLYTGHISYEDVIIKMVVLKMKKKPHHIK